MMHLKMLAQYSHSILVCAVVVSWCVKMDRLLTPDIWVSVQVCGRILGHNTRLRKQHPNKRWGNALRRDEASNNPDSECSSSKKR